MWFWETCLRESCRKSSHTSSRGNLFCLNINGNSLLTSLPLLYYFLLWTVEHTSEEVFYFLWLELRSQSLALHVYIWSSTGLFLEPLLFLIYSSNVSSIISIIAELSSMPMTKHCCKHFRCQVIFCIQNDVNAICNWVQPNFLSLNTHKLPKGPAPMFQMSLFPLMVSH